MPARSPQYVRASTSGGAARCALAHKRARLVEAIAAYPNLELTYVQPALSADPVVGYRTRAKLVAAPRDDGPGLSIGLYASGGGHVVLDTPRCRVVSQAIADAAAPGARPATGAKLPNAMTTIATVNAGMTDSG